MSRAPVTVVTVVLDGGAALERTLASIGSQTLPGVEVVVVDGGSTDDTLDVIARHREEITRWISEPDEGIYDAMNKGIRLATGRWIHFLNVGDEFHDDDVLRSLVEVDDGAALIYGCHVAEYGYFRRTHRPAPLERLRWGMIFSHQAMIVRTDLMKETGFDTSFTYSADYDFIYRLYRRGARFRFVDRRIARLAAGGVSEVNIEDTHRERWRIAREWESGWGRLRVDAGYARKLLTLRAVSILKRIIPTGVARMLTRLKYVGSGR